MEQFIGCDAHKKFSVFASIDEKGDYGRTVRIGHDREVFRKYLRELPPGSQIALETSGCYYRIVDEIEQAGQRARLIVTATAPLGGTLVYQWQVNGTDIPGANRPAAFEWQLGRSAYDRVRSPRLFEAG